MNHNTGKGRLRPCRFTIFLGSIAVLGAMLILLRVSHGIGLRTDGMYYIELARALADGERGLAWLSGGMPHLVWGSHPAWEGFTPLAQSAFWPPLLSILLVTFGGFAIDPLQLAGPLNAAAFALTIFIAGHWLRQRLRSRFLVVLGSLALLFSIPIAWWASWVMGEAVFILVATLALYCNERFLTLGRRSSLAWAAAFTALACLTRYAGLFLIVAFVPLLAMQRGVDLLEKGRRIGAYLAVATLPLGIWILRNLLATGTLTGPRAGDPHRSFVFNSALALRAIEAWNPLLVDLRVTLIPVDPRTGWIVGGIVVGVFLVFLAVVVSWCIMRWWKTAGRASSFVPVVGGFVCGYVPFIVIMTSLAPMPEIPRYLTPAYVPLTLLVFFVVDRCVANHQKLGLRKWRHGSLFRRFTGMEPSRILCGIPVVALAASVGYAGYTTVRDTRTAVLHPEYGWNHLAYNAAHPSVDATSATRYLERHLADARPAVRSYYDLYLANGDLLYLREACREDDVEASSTRAGDTRTTFFLYVYPVDKADLPGHLKEYGAENFFFINTSARVVRTAGRCLAVAPLPDYEIESIRTGQYEGDLTLWEETFTPEQ